MAGAGRREEARRQGRKEDADRPLQGKDAETIAYVFRMLGAGRKLPASDAEEPALNPRWSWGVV